MRLRVVAAEDVKKCWVGRERLRVAVSKRKGRGKAKAARRAALWAGRWRKVRGLRGRVLMVEDGVDETTMFYRLEVQMGIGEEGMLKTRSVESKAHCRVESW